MKVLTKICRYCGRKFRPDPRAVGNQRCCGREPCRRERRRRKWQSWIKRHPDYRKAADQRNKTKAWSKTYPDYWRQYRAANAEYRERERRRMVAKRRRARRVAKQAGIGKIAVGKLRKIESRGPKTVAKQTGIARRLDGVVQFLLWKEAVAKQTGMVSKSDSGR